MKKKNNKISTFFKIFLCLYLVIPLSCEISPFQSIDTCDGVEQLHIEIDSLTLTVGSIEIIDLEAEHSINSFSTDKSSSFDDAAISISIYELKQLASLNKGFKPKYNFSLINQAYACTLPAPEPIQKFTSIIISSNQTITIEGLIYDSGEDLSDFFSIASQYIEKEDIYENESIEDFISNQNDDIYRFATLGASTIFRLNTALTLPDQTLTFELNFDDNSTFSLTTNEFIIK